MLAIAIGVGAFALVQRSQARRSATAALADGLGAQAVADPHLDQAMLLGVEGERLHATDRTQGDLLTALLRSPSAERVYQGDGLRVNGLALSPDGKTLVLEDGNSNATVLDTATGKRLGRGKFPIAGNAVNLTFSPDGRLAVAGGRAVEFVDPRTGKVAQRLSTRFLGARASAPSNFAFSQGGRRLGVIFGSGPVATLVQWQLPSGRRLPRLIRVPGAGAELNQLGGRFSSNLAKGDGHVAEWNAATGKLLALPTRIRGGGAAIGLSFADQGTTVAIPQWGGGGAVVDPARRRVLVRSKLGGGVLGAAALSPDGRRVATTDFDGGLHVWDAATGKAVLPPIHASEVNVASVAWTPDGSRLITAGGDGTVRIYDAKTGDQVGASLPIAKVLYPQLSVSADGGTIAATDSGGKVWLYPATPASWAQDACRLADRNLTRAEWAQFVPGHRYRAICPTG